MGAGLAASPHCPAGSFGTEIPGALGRFRSRRGRGSFPASGAMPTLSLRPGCPWIPVRAEALAVLRRQIGTGGSAVHQLFYRQSRKVSWPTPEASLRSAPTDKDRSCCRFAAPGSKPGPARFSGKSPEASSLRPVAEAGRILLLPDRSWTEIPYLPVRHPGIETPFGIGRFTKPAAFASAQGQARSFRLAAASSAARPSLSPSPSGGTVRARLGLWLGSRSFVSAGSSRPRIEAVRKNESHQAQSACG